MKGFWRRAAAVFLSLTFLTAAIPVFAAEVPSEFVEAGVTVLNVTAAQIRSEGAYEAINAALLKARDKATDANPYKIVVEPGEYTLKTAVTNQDSDNSVDYNVLYLYSNTWLVLNGVTLKRVIGYNMLCTAYKDANGEKIAGYSTRNVIIDGGTFDSNATESVTTIKLGHARNVMMRNVTIKNAHNAHMMEIAAVDGLTMTGCTFDTQTLDAGKAGEEVVQLDVCQKNHMNHYLNEDLPLQNVTIEGCVFRNCPTGIGSHTSIYNAPHRNMVIRGNRFENLKTSAIKTLSWADSRIERNVINSVPGGIIVRELEKEGSGTYRSSVVAEEGGTTAHYSEDYHAPEGNLVVDNNIISSGEFPNPYNNKTARRAIAVLGSRVVNSTSYGRGGGLPKGDYPCKNVKVTNNVIQVTGDGVHAEYAAGIDVEKNVITHSGDSTGKMTDCGVTLLNSVSEANVRKNLITNAPDNGVRVGSGCAAKDINDNEIYTAGSCGIALDGAQITTVSTNEIRDAATRGISLENGAAVSYLVIGNRILRAATGIYESENSRVKLAEENLFSGCGWALAFYGSGRYSNNSFANGTLTGISPKPQSVTLAVGEATRLSKYPVPLEVSENYTYTSANPSVAKVDAATGRITAVSEGSTTVTIKSSGGVTAPVPVTVTAQAATNVVGDVDGDGFVTSIDNALIAGHVSKTGGYETVNTTQADVNNDGEINAKDRIILARYLERWEYYGTLPKDVTELAEKPCEIVLSQSEAQHGDTVAVTVALRGNPGVATAELELIYDESVLTLESVTDGGLLPGATAEHSDKLASPYHLSWANDLAEKNSTAEGVLVTLRFRVAENAPYGSYPIRLNTPATEVYNKALQTVPVTVSEGAVTVVRNANVLMGDANGNGAVTIEDVTHMQRHIAEQLTVNCFTAADINGDGVINIDDATAVQRFLAEMIEEL